MRATSPMAYSSSMMSPTTHTARSCTPLKMRVRECWSKLPSDACMGRLSVDVFFERLRQNVDPDVVDFLDPRHDRRRRFQREIREWRQRTAVHARQGDALAPDRTRGFHRGKDILRITAGAERNQYVARCRDGFDLARENAVITVV